MKILIVNNSVIPVKLYGGTERVIWYLGKELSKLGHHITYLVNRGSTCDFATVINIDESIDIINQIPNNIDFVHFNFAPYNIDRINKPYLITIHGNINDTNNFDMNSVFVSMNHASRYSSSSFVHNGLDWSDYTKPNFTKERKYFHFLGKAAWRVKNVRGAIDVVKNSKAQSLKVLGGVRFNMKMGLRFTLSPRISFYGMVGGNKKDSLLNGSKGLIFPVRWHEPFGLAITESLYYGCPVFGTPYGSIPEIVKDDFGYCSNESAKLTVAIEDYQKYNSKDCHEYALTEFNSKKMALAYLEKYEMVLCNEKLNLVAPHLKEIQTQKFLDWE